MDNLIIRQETAADYREVEHLTMRAFWNIHGPGCDEHLLVRKIRQSQDYLANLSRVAELNGRVVGAIYYTKAKVLDDKTEHDGAIGYRTNPAEYGYRKGFTRRDH